MSILISRKRRSVYSIDNLSRRVTTLLMFALILLSSVSRAGEPTREGKMKREKAPFRVLFSNDTTNITSCVSPYHKRGEPFRENMLEATVDETANTGIEVHMLQPAHGWVPWWQSKIYAIDEHHKWWREHYGVEPSNSYHSYLLKGGDIVDVFVNRCRERGQSPFISYRMNDAHHLHNVNNPENIRGPHAISRFYVEHPEYRLDPSDGGSGVQNWAIPEVRAHKFAFLEEVCENYDIDGLELDFMRHPQLFRTKETTSEQRVEIMTAFMDQVRELLDRTAKPGQYRWLCVRLPAYISEYEALGFDLPRMVAAGVDMLNLSIFYYTEQQTDLAEIRKMVPDTALYLEMTHCSYRQRWDVRLTTEEQFYTTAHLAYERGADGISVFNFVYYREYGLHNDAPYNEPPFHIFEHMGDPPWLGQQPQYYFLAGRGYVDRQLPKQFESGQTITFTMDMAPPGGGWKTGGRLRVQGTESLGDSQWAARFNGTVLKPNDDVSEAYSTPYAAKLGKPEELRAWTVEGNLLKDGFNSIEITLIEGEPTELIFLDVAVE